MTHTTTDAAEARALKACPFCGGKAKRYTIGNDEPNNAGGDVIVCTRCQASSHVEFGRKENLVSTWNNRATAEAASGAGEREPMVAMGAALAAAISLLERGGKKAAPSDKMFEQMLRDYRRALDNGRAALACLRPATDSAMRDMGGLVDMLSSVTMEEGVAVFEHSAEEIGIEVMEHHRAVLAALAAAPTIPATGEAIRAVTAEMRRFMPTACGDWADKIDDALAEEKGRKVAFYDEGGIDIRPGESLADRDRRIYQQGRHDALNDEPEAFI